VEGGINLDELKQLPIWLCWNYIIKDGKKTKKPCSVSGGATGTNKEYAHTLETYDTARKAADDNGYCGVGFVIPEGYFFLDIDHKALEDPFVQTLLNRFDSYTEYSVSGNGIHIYGKCNISKLPTFIDNKGIKRLDKQFYMKNPSNDLELYIGGLTNRFAVFTENIINDKLLHECTAAIICSGQVKL
jgi:primase-polymerase (primpol)-like protein